MTKREMVAEMKRRRDERICAGIRNTLYHEICAEVMFEVVAEAISSLDEPNTSGVYPQVKRS